MHRRKFAGGTVAAFGLLSAPQVLAQKVPGDVRFFCGFPPGGNADLLCRILPRRSSRRLARTSSSRASRAPRASSPTRSSPTRRRMDARSDWLRWRRCAWPPVMPGQKLPINVDTDLTPIASVANVPNILVFGKHVPFRTVPELIEAGEESGKIPCASAGNGTSRHLAGELFKKMAGVNLLRAPPGGGAPSRISSPAIVT